MPRPLRLEAWTLLQSLNVERVNQFPFSHERPNDHPGGTPQLRASVDVLSWLRWDQGEFGLNLWIRNDWQILSDPMQLRALLDRWYHDGLAIIIQTAATSGTVAMTPTINHLRLAAA